MADHQKTLASAEADTRRRAENIEDAVEGIEDAVTDQHSGYGVKVDTAPVEFFDTPTPIAEAILERFGKNTDDVLVEKGTENNYFDVNKVDLSRPSIERFTSEPRIDGNS